MVDQLYRFDTAINPKWIANATSVHLLFGKWDLLHETSQKDLQDHMKNA